MWLVAPRKFSNMLHRSTAAKPLQASSTGARCLEDKVCRSDERTLLPSGATAASSQALSPLNGQENLLPSNSAKPQSSMHLAIDGVRQASHVCFASSLSTTSTTRCMTGNHQTNPQRETLSSEPQTPGNAVWLQNKSTLSATLLHLIAHCHIKRCRGPPEVVVAGARLSPLSKLLC